MLILNPSSNCQKKNPQTKPCALTSLAQSASCNLWDVIKQTTECILFRSAPFPSHNPSPTSQYALAFPTPHRLKVQKHAQKKSPCKRASSQLLHPRREETLTPTIASRQPWVPSGDRRRSEEPGASPPPLPAVFPSITYPARALEQRPRPDPWRPPKPTAAGAAQGPDSG